MCRCHSLGLLILRLSLATIFIHQGWVHLANIHGTIAFFGKLGLPAFVAYLVGIVELVGGILALFGIWTRLAALGFVAIMIGVFYSTPSHGGFLSGHDYEFALAGASLALSLLGSGGYSVHAWFCKCSEKNPRGVCAWLCGSSCGCACGCKEGVPENK
jgi:uncharacterized membrane protein YphA (DoxX/SURF4 family)